jgi:biotin carboxyl carrier protein
LPRRYRVETYSGSIIDAEISDEDKNFIKIKLPGIEGEVKVRVKKIIDDKIAIIEVGNNKYKVILDDDKILINDETAMINKVIELIPIGLRTEYAGKKQVLKSKKGEIRAPLSGKIVEIKVKPGDKVSFGTVVALMESMKMITEIKSDVDGIVEEVLVEPGKAVNRGTLILRIKPLSKGKNK